jgi:putative membrane protein
MTTDVVPTGPAKRPLFGQPFPWLVMAIVLAMVPLAGWLAQSGWAWTRIHPAVNAMLNGSAAVFLVAGGLAIRKRALELHRQCMLGAFTASTVFLTSYLIRFATTGAHRYPGTGGDKTFYLVLLGTHTVLAAVAVPLILRALYLALKDRRAQHRRIVRFAYPIWLYVSLTGVMVYVMLYHVGPSLG